MNDNVQNTRDGEFINAEEFAVAAKEAAESKNVYVHKFTKPFTYEGKTYKELTFAWDDLSGNDYLAIESEMASLGKVVITPEFSGEFIIRMASKACTEKIGSDLLGVIPFKDFNMIRGKARSFLLSSAS